MTIKYRDMMASALSETGKNGDKVHLSFDVRTLFNGNFLAEVLICLDDKSNLVSAENIEVSIDGTLVRTEVREAEIGGGIRIASTSLEDDFIGVTAHEHINVTILLTQGITSVEGNIFGKMLVVA